MKPCAIFDMDGTLFDTERIYQENWLEAVKQFGQRPDPAFPVAVSGTNGEFQRKIIRRYYPDIDAAALQANCLARVDSLLDHQAPPEKPGARELLGFLRAHRVKIALASSSTRPRILSNLRQASLSAAFDVVVSGLEAAHGKPAPDVFLLAAEKLGCAPEDCYVFEDSLNGVRAGIAAGCATVMIPDLVPPPAGLTGHAAICASLLEVMELLERGLL